MPADDAVQSGAGNGGETRVGQVKMSSRASSLVNPPHLHHQGRESVRETEGVVWTHELVGAAEQSPVVFAAFRAVPVALQSSLGGGIRAFWGRSPREQRLLDGHHSGQPEVH